ncbi:MAG: 3'(2'),5'-bisphosphate nucleotidase [Deltaproteobacteria bacterium]|nr:MAG: 3'(2'),5'-bisphosphate nucleotidase [Deltaproteobacteria bacterium]
MTIEFSRLAVWFAAAKSAFFAGEKILEVYGKADFGVAEKTDQTPVTDADRKAHAVIADMLAETGIPLLSEEGRDIPFEERRKWKHMWLVDPLDGTKEFIKRNGEFTVNIALIENGNPVFGVVHVPVKNRLYLGAAEWGACVSSPTEKMFRDPLTWWESIQMSEKLIPQVYSESDRAKKKPYVLVASRSHLTPEVEAFAETCRQRYPAVSFVSAGSSLKFCLLAEGSAHIYPRLGPTMEWDTAAGQAVAQAAGATVVEWVSREPLLYNKPSLKNPWFVVSPSADTRGGLS